MCSAWCCVYATSFHSLGSCLICLLAQIPLWVIPGVPGFGPGWAVQVFLFSHLMPPVVPVCSVQEERAVRDRSLLQFRDLEQPIPWKVQFNLGNSSRPSNQCRNSVQGKHLITDELGEFPLGAPRWWKKSLALRPQTSWSFLLRFCSWASVVSHKLCVCVCYLDLGC